MDCVLRPLKGLVLQEFHRILNSEFVEDSRNCLTLNINDEEEELN